MASIDESYIDDDSDDVSIISNALEEILGGSQIHPELNAIDDRLKIHDCIKQTKNQWKGAELTAKSMGKGLHKFFGLL